MEAVASAASEVALTVVAVRTAAGMAAKAATALLVRRVDWRGFGCGAVEGGDERREGRNYGDGVSGGVGNRCSSDAVSESLAAAAITLAVMAVAVRVRSGPRRCWRRGGDDEEMATLARGVCMGGLWSSVWRGALF